MFIMKAVLIDAYNKTVTDIELNGRKDMLKQWYSAIGHDCATVETAVYIDTEGHDSILVDEEGLLKLTSNTPFFTFKGGHQPFAGNGIVVGVDKDGETVSCNTNAKEVAEKVKFLSAMEVRHSIG